MPTLRRIIAEVHRRSLWQVLSIYLVGAWIAYQVVLGLTDGIGLPDWVPGFAFVLFVIGLPIVLATAFINEGPPTLRRQEPEPQDWDETLLPGLAGQQAPAWIAESGVEEAGDGSTGGRSPWLSWRRSLGTGVLAFVALGAGTTGFMGMRAFGVGPAATLVSRQVLEAQDRVLLADFSNSGGSDLGAVVSEALRIDLMQTTIIRLVDPAEVREGLRMMHYDPSSGLPESAALQLAQRQGYKAVLVGDVSTLGGSYIVSARILSAADGAVAAAFREVARDSTRLIDAVDGLAKQIRAKAGESLRSVRASEPLWKVSTSSLSALRKYSEAERILATTGDGVRAVQLLEEAVAEDPEFASAYRKIGVILSNMGARPADRTAAIIRAWELRDRLPERERLYAVGSYHSTVSGDASAAAEAYRGLLDRYPGDPVGINNLSVALNRLGRHEETVALLAPGIRRPGVTSSEYTNIATALSILGRNDELRELVAHGLGTMPENASILSLAAQIPLLDGDFAASEVALRRMLDNAAPGSNRQMMATISLQSILQATGRLREMDRNSVRLSEMARSIGYATEPFLSEAYAAWARITELGDTASGLQRVRRLLEQMPLADMPVNDRPYLMLAALFGTAGDFATARQMIAAYERDVPLAERAGGTNLAATRAWLDLYEDPTPERIATFRDMPGGRLCNICRLPDIGMAWDRLGQADSAMAAYHAYIETPYVWRLDSDAGFRSHVLYRLAELHDDRGNREQAAHYYRQLLELWANADPEYRPRIQAIQGRLRALAGAG